MILAELLPSGYLIENKASTPDKFSYDTNKFTLPNDNFVISRDISGNILSVYSDDIWDLTPYSHIKFQVHKIYFRKELKVEINILQYKRLFFLLMVMEYGSTGSGLSVSSLLYHSSLIYSMALFSENKNLTLYEFLSSNLIIKSFIKSHLSQSYSSLMVTLLTFLQQTDNKITGVNFKEDEEILKILRKINTTSKNNVKQTEVIPSSILSNSIKERWLQINEIEKNINSLCKFIEKCISNKYFAASTKFLGSDYQYNIECIFWEDAIKEYNLFKLFKKYEITNKQKLKRFLRKIQGTGYHLILAYSGMRRSEALSLTTNCLDFIDNKKYARIIGYTTKFEGTRKKVNWVTTKEIEKVINILKMISNSLSIKLYFEKENQPLFISTSNFTSKPNKVPTIIAAPYLNNDTLEITNDLIRITEKHILELEQIEYSRDWRNEENFKIGQVWKFKTHQYRRSLAVYSIQSGLISLGALQKQFKHLFREMSYYYQNGSANAKNIFDVNKLSHISKDLDKVKPELEALSYIKNILFSNEKLYGVQGNIINKKIENYYKKDKLLILKDRKETINNFKNGYISWKETMLGGCVQVEPCESRLTKSLVACIGCDSGVHKIEKIRSAIIIQKEFLDILETTSIEYKTEKEVLNKLNSYLKNLTGNHNGDN